MNESKRDGERNIFRHLHRLQFLDTPELLKVVLLELDWRQMTIATMSSFGIAKQFDVIEDILSRVSSLSCRFVVDSLRFISWKKLSPTALSWQLTRRLMLASRLLAFR